MINCSSEARPASTKPTLVESLANTPGTWAVEAVLATTLTEARQHIPAEMATLEETPDGVILRCNVQDLGWFARVLAGLNMPLKVRRPPELRDALRQHAVHVAQLAEA
jgi:predicted DNA-binding transcriptional regulator YafY